MKDPARPSPRLEGADQNPALSSGAVLLWLAAASLVGVLGALLLEGARLAAPAALFPACLVVLPLELVLYLLALRDLGSGRRVLGRIWLGVILGLALRAAWAAGAALVRTSPLAEADPGSQFLLYYVRLWPGALVQILALCALLYILLDNLRPRAAEAERAPAAAVPALDHLDEEERHRVLLEALMEPQEPAAPAPEPAPRRSRWRRRVSAAQPTLLSEEPAPAPEPEESEPPGVITSAPAPALGPPPVEPASEPDDEPEPPGVITSAPEPALGPPPVQPAAEPDDEPEPPGVIAFGSGSAPSPDDTSLLDIVPPAPPEEPPSGER